MKQLNAQQLSCGYVQSASSTHASGITTVLKLWREHSVYHVRITDSLGMRKWESFRTLTEARKLYAALKRASDVR